MTDSLWPHGMKRSRLPCPSLSPRVCSLMSIESVMPSNHLILPCSLLLLPSIFSSIRVFSSESVFQIRWPKYWNFSISPSSEYSGLVSIRIDWFDLLAVQGTIKSPPALQFWNINSLAISILYGPTDICTWLLEKSELWLYGPLSVEWCLCFFICCLGLS